MSPRIGNFPCGTIERSPSGPWPQFRERVRGSEGEGGRGRGGGGAEGGLQRRRDGRNKRGRRDKEMLCQDSIRAARRSVTPGIKHGGQQEALSADSLFDSLLYSWCSSPPPPPPQTSECEPANQIHSFACRKSLVGGSLELRFPWWWRWDSTPLCHPSFRRRGKLEILVEKTV